MKMEKKLKDIELTIALKAYELEKLENELAEKKEELSKINQYTIETADGRLKGAYEAYMFIYSQTKSKELAAKAFDSYLIGGASLETKELLKIKPFEKSEKEKTYQPPDWAKEPANRF